MPTANKGVALTHMVRETSFTARFDLVTGGAAAPLVGIFARSNVPFVKQIEAMTKAFPDFAGQLVIRGITVLVVFDGDMPPSTPDTHITFTIYQDDLIPNQVAFPGFA